MNATIAIFGDPVDARALEQIETCMKDERAVAGALMADHHLGYSMPIGGVVAYDGAISPSGVGFDIACGNKAVLTNLRIEDVVGATLAETLAGTGQFPYGAANRDEASGDACETARASDRLELKNEASLHAYSATGSESDLPAILRQIQRDIEFGVGRKNANPIDHDLFDDGLWADLEKLLPGVKKLAASQLGTVGSGNHYVDILADQNGRIWVANHFGSRGFGHKTATAFLNLAEGREPADRAAEKEEPTVLDLDTDLGAFYFQAMELAGRYAYAGRDYVIDQVLRILDSPPLEEVHNHHNYAWAEDGLIVVRKGATPLSGDLAFIGASMGEPSVIVRGTGDDIGNLASAPHGAGRVMSRTKAAGRFVKKTVERTAPDGSKFKKKLRVRDASTAAINWDAEKARLASEGIVVLGAGADEAPGAYKTLAEVLTHHPNIEVVHRLRPLGVVMAGDDTFDPYKD